MNYTVTIPEESPEVWLLQDESGTDVAIARTEGLANVFAHVPELLRMLDDAIASTPMWWSDAVELQEKLKPFRQ